MATRKPPSDVSTPFAAPQPSFRSGAVARMAGMPVSTLRIWEQRYQAVGPTTAPSGHRLYAAAEVERVILLRQLTEQGHAIGSLAALDTEQLRSLAVPQASAQGQGGFQGMRGGAPLRVVVVGQAMAQRLQRPAVLRRWGRPPQVVAVFDSLWDATQAAAVPAAPIDVLLWQTAGLQDRALADLKAAQQAWSPRCTAVAYRFAGAATRQALAGTGAVLARETADDDALGTWLRSLEAALVEKTEAGRQADTGSGAWSLAALGLAGAAAPARRFDDATLTKFAGLATGVACDCPSHVAELLMQLAAFEAYTADCAHRSPQDAALHADLQRVAGAARVLFEVALERVAVAEGWALP